MATTASARSARRSGFDAGLDIGGLEPALDDPQAGADGKQARLADSLARLRRRTRLVATERWLLVAGSVMVPLGGILVMLGWFGAAHTGRLFEQIPYMISGGFFGLVLVIAGGFSYFGYWLTRLVSDEREHSRQLLDALVRIEGHLARNGAAPAPVGVAAPASGRPEFVATLTGSLYHHPDCAIVADRPPQDLRSVRAGAKGRAPCRMCLPAGAGDDEPGTNPDKRPEPGTPDPAGRD